MPQGSGEKKEEKKPELSTLEALLNFLFDWYKSLDENGPQKDEPVPADITNAEKQVIETLLPSIKLFENNFNAITGITVEMGSALSRSANPEVAKRAVSNYLKNLLVPESRKTQKEEFYQRFNVAPKDQLSDEEIESRRKLSEAVVDKYVNRSVENSFADRLFGESGIRVDGCNHRRFVTFFFKPQAKYAQENLDLARKFFGYGTDNKPLDIAPEELKQTRIEILKNRVEEYRKLADSLKGPFTDEKIAEKFEEINELGFGMGMEWKDLFDELKKMGVDPGAEWEAGIQDLHKKAYYLKNAIEIRNTYIASPDYMFGAEEKMISYDVFPQIMAEKGMFDAKTAYQVATVASQLANERMERAYGILGAKINGIEAVFDDKGNMIPYGRDGFVDSQKLHEACGTSKQIYIFKKGDPNPHAIEFGESRDYPPEVSEGKVPEADLNPMIFSKKLNLIENNKDLSDAQRNFETNIVQDEFELAVIAESARKAPEASKKEYRDSLKEKLASYVAGLTVKKKLETPGLDKDTIEMLCSPESIDAYVKSLSSTGALDQLVDDVDKLDYSKLDADKIYNQFLGHYKEENLQQQKAKQEKTAAKNLEESKKIYSNVKCSMSAGREKSLMDDSLWGLTPENKKIKSDFAGTSVSRARIQTLACAVMLNNGFAVKDIMKETPGMQNIREKAAKHAIRLLADNKGRAIADQLVKGGEKLNKYLEGSLGNMSKLDPMEFLSDKNKEVRTACTILKDFFQESQVTQQMLKTASKQFKEKNPDLPVPRTIAPIDETRLQSMRDINDSYSQINFFTTGGLIDTAKSVRDNEPAEMTIETCLGNCVLSAGKQKYMNILAKNSGKNMAELCSQEDAVTSATDASIPMLSSDAFGDIIDEAKINPLYAKRVVIAMLDGTIGSDEVMKTVTNEQGVISFELDKKAFDKKLLSIRPDELNKLAAQDKQMQKENDAPQMGGMQ